MLYFREVLFLAQICSFAYLIFLAMSFQIVIGHCCAYSPNLLYMMLIVTGCLWFASPPTKRTLLSSISLDILVMADEDEEDVELVVIAMGTRTTLFQFSVAVPFSLASYIEEISIEMLLNVYVLLELLYVAIYDFLESGSSLFSKNLYMSSFGSMRI